MYTEENMICSFCVNDYHLSVILVEYIYEAINESKNVMTFLERDLSQICNKVIQTNSKFWENENIFEKIDFAKTRFDKLSEKFENAQEGDIAIIVGSEDFIDRLNRLLINFHTNFTIVNCFNISEVAKDENFKLTKYSKILDTKGLREIEKLDLI